MQDRCKTSIAFLLGQCCAWGAFWQLLPEGFRTFCKHHLCHAVDTAGTGISNPPFPFANPFFNSESGKALKVLKVIRRLDGVVLIKGGYQPLWPPWEQPCSTRLSGAMVQGMPRLTRAGNMVLAPAQHRFPATQAQPYRETLRSVWPRTLPWMYREENQCDAKTKLHGDVHHKIKSKCFQVMSVSLMLSRCF